MEPVIESRSTFSKDWVGTKHLEKCFSDFQVHVYHLDTSLPVGSDSLAVEWADDSASPTCPRWEGVCRLSSELWETTLLLSSTSFHPLVWSVSGTRLPLLNSLPYVLLVSFPCLLPLFTYNCSAFALILFAGPTRDRLVCLSWPRWNCLVLLVRFCTTFLVLSPALFHIASPLLWNQTSLSYYFQ